MSIINGTKITAPVSASDPYRVMGVARRTIGYDVGYVCSNLHGKINKWAMYKPVKYDSPGELTAEQRRSVLYGLVRPLIYTANYNTDSDWSYNPPSGADWARLLDFDGYHHGAVPGVHRCGWPAFITVDQTVNIPRPTGDASDGCIPAEHLLSMRNSAGNAWTPMYWGVGYRFYPNDAWKVKTVDETVSSSSPNMTFPLKVVDDIKEWSQHQMANPTLYLCVFLSETRIPDWTSTAKIIPLPRYTAEYRFHEYTGTGLRYYYAPLHKAMNADGRGQTEYTRTDLLNAKPITLFITFLQNPYSSRGAYAPSAGTKFKIRYHKYSYSNGNDVESSTVYEKQFTSADLQMTVDNTAKTAVARLTIPRSDMLDESLKNLNGNPAWPFEVWEYAQTDNAGTMEWREITDYTAQPYIRYNGIH